MVSSELDAACNRIVKRKRIRVVVVAIIAVASFKLHARWLASS